MDQAAKSSLICWHSQGACGCCSENAAISELNRGPRTMKSLFKRFLKDESGATAIEYGLIAALIALAIITMVTLAGSNLSNLFNRIATALD
jgi:pilus assembly protein Flp/PilA